MLKGTNLQGMYFEGFFRRDPNENKRLRESIETLWMHNHFLCPRVQVEEGGMEEYGLNFQIVWHSGGLFVARGIDKFGPSGLSGEIQGKKISFSQQYRELDDTKENHERGHHSLLMYTGSVITKNSEIMLDGSFAPDRGPSIFNGNWRAIYSPERILDITQDLPMPK